MDAFLGDVEIHVAAAQEDRRSIQRTLVVALGIIRADQCAAQSHEAAVTAGVAGGKFKRQAAALRKAQDHNALGRHAALDELIEDITHQVEGGSQPGFVGGEGIEEAVGVPGIAEGLGCDIEKPGLGQLAGQGQDIFGRGAAAVHHEHGSFGVLERLAGGADLDASFGD